MITVICFFAGEDDHSDITDYLWRLDKTQLHHLGITLGIGFTRLNSMRGSDIFCDELVNAWLQKVDSVIKKGLPSWKMLVTALRSEKLGQTDLANRIARDKNVK